MGPRYSTPQTISLLSRPFSYMMNLGSLTDLPPELICMILCEVNSIRNFYSLIRVSSQIHAAFVAIQNPLISELLKRAVSAEVLWPDAQITSRSHEDLRKSEGNLNRSFSLSATSRRLPSWKRSFHSSCQFHFPGSNQPSNV